MASPRQPLVPPDVDVSIFKLVEMPFELLTHESFAGLSAEAFRAQTYLVFASWRQKPAGSLPQADVTLAQLAGYGRDVASFKAVRAECFSAGWVECNDGRVYFEPLVDVVKEAFARRKDGGGLASRRKRRGRMKLALMNLGIPELALSPQVIDSAVASMQARGADNLRGQARANALRMVASDLGLLAAGGPQAGEPDIRLLAAMNGGRSR